MLWPKESQDKMRQGIKARALHKMSGQGMAYRSKVEALVFFGFLICASQKRLSGDKKWQMQSDIEIKFEVIRRRMAMTAQGLVFGLFSS